MRASPPATVIVCTRDRGQLLTECVREIMADLRTHDELIVVEAQSVGIPDLATRHEDPRLRWIAAAQPGKSRQLNLGIRHAHNKVVVITDDDCLVPAGWISAMAEPFLERDVGIAFGSVDGLTRLPGPAPELPGPGPAPADVWRFSHGAAMAIRRQAVIDAGGFDERLGPGARVHGEEADLMLRMHSAGWRCFVADAPPVRHVEWRTPGEEVRNRLVYERGAGAWVGAAIRRGSASAAATIVSRLRYQGAHLRTPGAFALRAEIAFCSGVATGLGLTPRRFLPAADQQAPPASKPHVIGARPIERLPWPGVYGRRCLCLANDEQLAFELDRRQAGEVTVLRPRDTGLGDLTASQIGRFDLVVAHDLAGADEPVRWLRALASICDSHLLSIERIHLWLTLLGRRRPYVARHAVMNGSAHRRLLEAAGLEVQLAGRPWIVRDAGGHRYAERAILTRPANLSAPHTRSSIEDAAGA